MNFKIKRKILLGLMLVAVCQVALFSIPVNALAWEVTTWVTVGGTYSRGSTLDANDNWRVEWNVIQGGNGQINVYFENETGYAFITKLNSTGDTVVFVAPTNGTFSAKFRNPVGAPGQVQVYILTENLGQPIPGFELFITLGILALIVVLFLRKPTKIIEMS